MPIFYHRVEHQNDLDLPSEFLLTSINTGIVHFLSGLTCCTCKFLSDPVVKPYPRTACNLLGPCFNTGLIFSAYSLVFSLFHFLNETFSYFLRSTYLLSVSPLYLALDDTTTCSHCTTKQCYSPFVSVFRGYHPLWLLFPKDQLTYYITTLLRVYHQSSFLFSRPYYGNPCLFLFLSLMICLSPRRTPA